MGVVQVHTTVTSEFTIRLFDNFSFANAEEQVKSSLKDANIISIEAEEEFSKGELSCVLYKIKVIHTLSV